MGLMSDSTNPKTKTQSPKPARCALAKPTFRSEGLAEPPPPYAHSDFPSHCPQILRWRRCAGFAVAHQGRGEIRRRQRQSGRGEPFGVQVVLSENRPRGSREVREGHRAQLDRVVAAG